MESSMKIFILSAVIFICWDVTLATNENVTESINFLDHFLTQIDNYAVKTSISRHYEEYKKTIYVEEHLEGERRKREAKAETTSSGWIRHERAIHEDDWSLKVHLVSFHKSNRRTKRAAYNTTTETWPRKIPYKFDSTYDVNLIPKVKRIMKEVMDHLCIEWVEEPDFDPDNNNYDTNAYLRFIGGSNSICGTYLGQGNGHGPRNIQTCTQYASIVHELLHTLGAIHEQQGPLSLGHLTMKPENVLNGYWGGTYKLHNHPSRIETSEFDGSSILMYGRRAFSRNGLDVMMPFREEEFQLNWRRRSNLQNNYMELNEIYKCRQYACNNTNVDCGDGYYTQVKGECKCVCPLGFDSASNCQQLENENSGPTSWPDVPFSLYAIEANLCPAGFSPARFDITGTGAPYFFDDPFFRTGSTTNFYMCTRDDSGINSDMDALPMGTYCVVKPASTDCNGGFSYGFYNVTAEAAFQYTGDYGDWETFMEDGKHKVLMKFCCRWDKDWFYTMEVPTQTGFRLISDNGQCPFIRGMRFKIGRVAMFQQGTTRHLDYPLSWTRNHYIIHNFCTYTPPIYGCSQDVTLDANQPFIYIDTPGYNYGSRDPNRRCLYNFNVPDDARVKITILDYDIEADDFFYIRRFNKWALPYMEFSANFQQEFISEKNFLFLEYWSSTKASTRLGIKFVAEVLLAGDNCYDVSNRGENYNGNKWVTESFEECLPWSEASDCPDFPFADADSINMLTESNYCRNPGGAMERPWCYVSVNRGMCKRAYCDVCNNLGDYDRLSNCQALKDADAGFCDNALQRAKCATTCNLNINQALPASTGTCGTPETPSDGSPLTALQSEYQVGEFAYFTCDLHTVASPIAVQCTETGWHNLESACSECPPGWVPYGDRCYFYTPDIMYIDEAHEMCVANGGEIFNLRDGDDVEVIRHFKQNSAISGANGASWVAIEKVNGNWVKYGNHSAPAPYLDWSTVATFVDDGEHDCAVMIYESDSGGNAGRFNTTDCFLAGSRTFCEIPRSAAICSDRWNNCPDAIGKDPDFCRRADSYPVAARYCEYSCGLCVESNGVCNEPTGNSNVFRYSQDSTVDAGEVMEFACNSGTYHTSGDLRRTCGQDGTFYGEEPVCSNVPNTQDIGVGGVLNRLDVMHTNKIYLFDIDTFRIAFNGIITHWHYVAVKTGTVQFVVYRFNPFNGVWYMVGYNTVTVGTIKERWTVAVPAANQIAVQPGDVYGVFSISAHIAATSCQGREEQLVMLPYEPADSTDQLYGDKGFTLFDCIIPSVGLRIKPT